MMIIYLHGFRSSPLSAKALAFAEELKRQEEQSRYFAPKLDSSPAQAIACVHRLIQDQRQDNEPLCFIGSSLGGYYATYLAHYYQAKALLINPVVYACRDLSTQLGHKTDFYHQDAFSFNAQHVAELAAFYIAHIDKPKNILLAACTHDETLDCKEMRQKFAQSEQIIVQGGDHSFSMLSTYMNNFMHFIQQPLTTSFSG